MKYSKIVHTITLCCFFLPFFYTGCGDEDKASIEKAKQDSIAAVESGTTDTISQNENSVITKDTIVENTQSQIDSVNEQVAAEREDSTAKPQEAKDNLALLLSDKFPFLRPLLVPRTNTYTGIAIILNSAPLIFYFGTFIAFLLLLLCMLLKYIEPFARKTFFILDLLALLILFFSKAAEFNSESLWGFKVCLIAIAVLTAYDFYILRKNKQTPINTDSI